MPLTMTKLTTQSIARISLMAALTIGLSFVRIPYAVPFTLLTLSCMIAGLILPKNEAVLSQIMYIVLGLIGLPIFTAGGGLSYVIYPTFGYIIFLPVMSYIIASLKEKNIIVALIAGSLPQLLFGALYYFFILTVIQNVENELGSILMALFVTFIPVEILKAVAAYLLYINLPKNFKENLK